MTSILVVDDELINLQILTDLLEHHYQVMAAPQGEKALQLAVQQPQPDLILLDIMMPDMNGFEVCRRLKSDPQTRDIPVIFVTALTDTQQESQGLALGAVDYITKPFSADVVLARVATHLALHRLTRELERQVAQRTHALKQSMAEAGVASRAKMQFLANMNHELRTPLNAILGNAATLMASPLNDQQRHQIEQLHSAADSLNKMLARVLLVARDDDRALSLHCEPLRLNDCLQAALAEVAQPAHFKNIRLSLRPEAGLPEGVEGDATLIGCVLGYLLDNAVKFSPAGSEVVLAHGLEKDWNGLTWRLEVIDQGMGIAPEQQAHLFEAFSQADGSTTREQGGMGIGLALVRKLLGLLRGEISLTSQPGEGSNFCVRIPVQRLTRPLPPPVASQTQAAASDQPAVPDAPVASIDPQHLQPLLAELERRLEDFDVHSLELAQQCASQLGQSAAAQRLLEALNHYDFTSAETALQALRQELGISG
ncbi:MAG: hybrid sensor histidine kinase/response regulator [Gammaproteobacteria bacterium]|nr:hybrid sensor histidine kinase/response regulator [Gammaproteobacteria bacterium]